VTTTSSGEARRREPGTVLWIEVMTPRLVACLLVAACAQARTAPQHPGDFTWAFDNGVISAGHRRQNPQPLDTPLPTDEQVAATRTATLAMPGPTEGAVRFCVGPTGSVTMADTETPTGDTGLDALLRDTVRTWTFRPAEFGGLRVEGCATAKFVPLD
jgi:TonB family protein